jgi:hypothetical protein
VQRKNSRQLSIGLLAGRVLATVLLLGIATVSIAAETDGTDDPAATVDSDNEKWQPALGMGFLLSYQNQQGSSDLGIGSNLPGTTDAMVSPGFRFDASLATPVLIESRFAPRVFAQIGTQLLLEDNFVAWRSIGSVRSTTTETLVQSSIDSQWYAGIGLEFSIPAGEREVKLRTSVDYLGQTMSAFGTSDVTTRSSTGPAMETHYESLVSEITNHALGAGVSAEAAVYSWRDMRVSLFLETRFAWLLDNNSITLRAVSGNPTDGFSDFTVIPDAFIAQGGGGIRITWLPVW